jgi:uncharacterized protein DUF1569
MKTMFDESLRGEILRRIDRVSGDARPLWGKMNAEQMLTHLIASMRMAIGELQTKSRKSPIRFPPLRQFVVYWMPWPKGVSTAPELLPPANCENVEQSKSELSRLLAVFAARGSEMKWPLHPMFGNLGGKGWGILSWRHFDHHLRQFGV